MQLRQALHRAAPASYMVLDVKPPVHCISYQKVLLSMTYRIFCPLPALTIAVLLLAVPAFASDNACGPMTPAEEHPLTLLQDNLALTARVQELESHRGISAEQLRQKKVERLRRIAAEVKMQRQTTADFQRFVTWMSINLAGYNKYIQAGSYAAVIARVLPIPYAGQASIFTKFVAQFTIALNNASLAISTYLNSSQKFIAMVDRLEPAGAPDPKAVIEASKYADQHLLKEMSDAQFKLSNVADLSSGALAFLETLNHYMSGTDEYWNKARGIFKKDIDLKEKSYISESTSNLKSQAASFNSKLKTFEELSGKQTASVKSLAVYDELLAELAI